MKEHTAIAQMPAEDRPRERLLRLGPGRIRDAELLAIVIGSGSRGCSSLELARRILKSTSGTGALNAVTVEQLLEVEGVGPALAMRVVAAGELFRRGTRRLVRQGQPAPASGGPEEEELRGREN